MTIRRSGGRPPRSQSALIEDRILDSAERLFLAHGYGAVSIEKVAQSCGISKRTFYHRFENKEKLFAAVAHRLISRLRPENVQRLFEGNTLGAILLRLADIIMDAALNPEALALHRILLAEAMRFPELAIVMESEGSKAEAITRIGQLLEQEARAKNLRLDDSRFAAQQFLQMLTGVPRQRALGLGTPMTAEELTRWKAQTVCLFLHGWKEVVP